MNHMRFGPIRIYFSHLHEKLRGVRKNYHPSFQTELPGVYSGCTQSTICREAACFRRLLSFFIGTSRKNHRTYAYMEA